MYINSLGDAVSQTKTEKNQSTNNDKNDPSLIEDNDNVSKNNDIEKIDFSKLENFLHPKSGSLRQIIEERVIKQPKILSEMLSVNFSDLVAVFQDLFLQQNSKHRTVDEIYTELLDFVDKEGSEGIRNYAASLNNKNR